MQVGIEYSRSKETRESALDKPAGLKFGNSIVYGNCIKTEGLVLNYGDIEYFTYTDITTVVNA